MVINNFNKAVINSPEDSKLYVIKGRLPRMQNGEVLIKVIASGLSFTDTMICKDIYPEMSVKFPLCPGYDIIGEVVKSTSDSIKVGETVCALTFVGGCSEYICLSAHKIVVVPKNIDPIKTLCLALPYVTALQMMTRLTKLKPRSIILVLGAGGAVGQAICDLAQNYQVTVFGVDRKEKFSSISNFNAIPIDRTKDISEQLIKYSVTQVDCIFNPIGYEHSKKNISLLKDYGTLISFGFFEKSLGRHSKLHIIRDFLRYKMLSFTHIRKALKFYSISKFYRKNISWFSEDMGLLVKLMLEDKISPTIAGIYTLDQINKAFDSLKKRLSNGRHIIKHR